MSTVELDDDVRVALRVLLDDVHRFRDTAAVSAILDRLREHLGTPDEPWPLGALDEALQGDDGCPECPGGIVVAAGRQDRETGHTPAGCDSCQYVA